MNHFKLKEYFQRNSLVFSILVSSIVISSVIYTRYSLSILQQIFSILGSLSLGVALFTYFYKKKQDQVLAALGQIEFFREKIIPEWDKTQEIIKGKYPTFTFVRVPFNNVNLSEIRTKCSRNFEKQLSVFLSHAEESPVPMINEPLLKRNVWLLNMLEEFSLRVGYFETEYNPALRSVHGAFVEIVECNTAALFYVRDVINGQPLYPGLLKLYFSWNKNVTKTSYIKNLEKYGFITKEQREKIHQIKRENY